MYPLDSLSRAALCPSSPATVFWRTWHGHDVIEFEELEELIGLQVRPQRLPLRITAHANVSGFATAGIIGNKQLRNRY